MSKLTFPFASIPFLNTDDERWCFSIKEGIDCDDDDDEDDIFGSSIVVVVFVFVVVGDDDDVKSSSLFSTTQSLGIVNVDASSTFVSSIEP